MTEEVPSDVHAVLTQLLRASQTAVRADDLATVDQAIETVETVSTNKLPAGDRRARLLHGCTEVRSTLDERDCEATMAYLAAMERRLHV